MRDQSDWHFELGDREFAFLAGLVRQRIGISLGPQKREMVRSRLSKRVRLLGLEGFRDYCKLLSSDQGEDELGHALNAITTNLTRFFRESHHFDHLRASLPDILKAKRDGGEDLRLRLWSAGCSSGEEPYSMAMTLADAVPDLRGWDARILATDVDTDMLERARAGLYPADAAADVPPRLRTRFLHRAEGGRLGVNDSLKALVAFKPLNLIGPWPMRRRFDAIFCRNVAIYFDRDVQTRLVAQLAERLKPGGHLYIGHSESLSGLSDLFELVGRTIYRRLP